VKLLVRPRTKRTMVLGRTPKNTQGRPTKLLVGLPQPAGRQTGSRLAGLPVLKGRHSGVALAHDKSGSPGLAAGILVVAGMTNRRG